MQDDGRRPPESMPSDGVRILFIEGYCQVSWMETHIVNNLTGGGVQTFRVWVTDPAFLSEDSPRPDAFGIEKCIEEIESGKYHAIVVVDCSNSEMFEEFERSLAPHIQKFVQNGGAAAFPSSEGGLLVKTFESFFDTVWQRSGYYRTIWGPCEENMLNVNYCFGNGHLSRSVIQPYSAKTVSLRNVPPHERCFGVTPESRTQSMVPFFDGEDVSKPGDPASAMASAEELDPDYDIAVAVHNYGQGCVAYIGDVNCEEQTVRLIEAFCVSRCPQHPVDCCAFLSPDVVTEVLDWKEKGNDAFKKRNYTQAVKYYQSAIDLYGGSRGKRGEQRDLLVALHSNCALVHFKAENYSESEVCASEALELDSCHPKALFRRASARYEIGKAMESIWILKDALKDVTDMPPADSALQKDFVKLTKNIEAEIKRLKTKERESFQKNFSGAL